MSSDDARLCEAELLGRLALLLLELNKMINLLHGIFNHFGRGSLCVSTKIQKAGDELILLLSHLQTIYFFIFLIYGRMKNGCFSGFTRNLLKCGFLRTCVRIMSHRSWRPVIPSSVSNSHESFSS